MKMMWNYGAIALLTLAAAAMVATGEAASAELKLAESAAHAAADVGTTALGFLASPASITATPDKTSVP
jgi:hypothetical protein